MSSMTATVDPGADADNVFDFVGPILGFEGERSFALSPLEDSGTLWSLESTTNPDLRFVLAAPAPFFPDYAPTVEENAVAPLASAGDELTVLVILTVDGPIRTATANLLAPVILALGNRRAMQLVLPDDTNSVRAPIAPTGGH